MSNNNNPEEISEANLDYLSQVLFNLNGAIQQLEIADRWEEFLGKKYYQGIIAMGLYNLGVCLKIQDSQWLLKSLPVSRFNN